MQKVRLIDSGSAALAAVQHSVVHGLTCKLPAVLEPQCFLGGSYSQQAAAASIPAGHAHQIQEPQD